MIKLGIQIFYVMTHHILYLNFLFLGKLIRTSSIMMPSGCALKCTGETTNSSNVSRNLFEVSGISMIGSSHI